MKLVIVDDERALGHAAAAEVVALLDAGPATLAVPTGGTPMALYAELVREHRTALARATTFNLDEYLGLAATDPRSCAAFMEEHLFRHARLAAHHLLCGAAIDPRAECARYERALVDAGGLDLAILGIGRNGHVGFNEPGAPLDGRTAIADVDPRTLVDNARLHPSGTVLPSRGLTMGLGTITDARALVLLAFGAAKADALFAAVRGPIAASCPASVVQAHAHATVIVDRAAAARLTDDRGA